ncbi:MAG: hypothetical protein ACLP9L_13380 [Thermoguttaceae bacterium]
MTRGPVHEAFALPATLGEIPGMIVPKKPAGPIDEVPPDMKPEGENVVWIPGYWSWDDDRQDFIWVSGVWRVPPPGYRWIPGYWREVPGKGYQWISGYWLPAQFEEATYLSEPPKGFEAGPTSSPPDEDHFWVAGYWQWFETHFVWRHGYWSQLRVDWIWQPDAYYWSPRGWLYVAGYWDYPLARRGLAFSLVCFSGPVTAYQPADCLDVGAISVSLFCRPSYCHYYFGDYYDDSYAALGIGPWFNYDLPPYGYDSLYSYYRWYNVTRLGQRQWDQRLRGWHDYYRAHPEMRPPRTLAAQEALLASNPGRSRPDIQQIHLAHDVHQFSKKPGAFVKLQTVSQAERVQLRQAAEATLRFGNERQQFERTTIVGGADTAGRDGPLNPVTLNLKEMPSFKSRELPGAAASNSNSGLGRPAGGVAVSATAAGATIAGSMGRTTSGAGPVTSASSNPGTAEPGHGLPSGAVSPINVSSGIISPGIASRGVISPGIVTGGAVSPGIISSSAVSPGAVSPHASLPSAVILGPSNPGGGNAEGGNSGSGNRSRQEHPKNP